MLTINTPRDKDIHTVADFCELLCLVQPDRESSADFLQDYIKDKEGSITQDELDDCFAHLRWRQSAFGLHYPFSIHNTRNTMEAPTTLTDPQKFYVFLLLAANLPMLARTNYKSLTDAFEDAALLTLKEMWPLNGDVKPFGKNNTHYTGNKAARLNRLGSDIGGKPQLSPNHFREADSGDGGIDLVSWLTLDIFESQNIPSLLGQCACSREEWSAKQSEISASRLAHMLVPTHPWMEAIFMPLCFRNNSGRWAVPGDVARAVVVDRLRMVGFFDGNNNLANLPLPPVVNQVLEYSQDLV